MKVPDDKEVGFSSESEVDSKPIVKSPLKREKSPSPVNWSTPKHGQREEKVARTAEPTELAQIKRKTGDIKERTESGQKEIKK